MNTLLVTGGAGFIGGTFVRQVIRETNARVINLDALTYAGNMDSLDAVARDEAEDLHGPVLAHAVHAGDALFQDRRVPRQVHVDDDVGVLQIQTDAARVRRQECPAAAILSKSIDQVEFGIPGCRGIPWERNRLLR